MKRMWMRIRKLIGWWLKGIRRAIRHMSPMQRRLALVAIVALVCGGILGGLLGHAIESLQSKKKVAEATAQVKEEEQKKLDVALKELYNLKDQTNQLDDSLPWNLTLVNEAHPMKEGYVPELAEIEKGYSIDRKVADMTRKMLADAKKEGLHIVICSAYRSVERQEQVFSSSMKERVKSGMSYWEAYEETARNVAKPGTSEHALGLALDLISNQYEELDERQEGTREAKWLEENCAKYGFILRYPPEKTQITGIIYEPWHYRYVGKEHAEKIMNLGITLEEYLQDYYEPEGDK